MIIVMLGAPGAGKGTQAARIAEAFGLPHISTGDIFRSNLKEGTELGLKAKAYMDAGELVPDSLTVELLLDRVAAADCENGYVLDGFPRTVAQADALKEALAKIGKDVSFAINVDVPDENIMERMMGRRSCPACGAGFHTKFHPPVKEGVCDRCGAALIQRDDDKPETVQNRLSVYHEQTQPLIAYYEKEGVLRTVDGTQSMDEVFSAISGILRA